MDVTGDARAQLVVSHLRDCGVDVGPAAEARVVQLSGGWSRHSYVLTAPRTGGETAEFVVRVRPSGGLLDTDLEREFEIYAALQHEEVPIPRVFGFHDDGNNVFEGPFFVMERLPGHAPNVWRRRDRELLERNWASSRSLADDLVGILARIHLVENPVVRDAAGERAFVDLVDHWETTWHEVRLGPDPVIDSTFSWLRERSPTAVRSGLVHGDYRIGNTLVVDERIRGILDWELCYWGDPHFDLAYVSLPYLAGKFFEPVTDLLSGVADRGYFFARYEELTGAEVVHDDVRTYSGLGAVILMVILTTGVRRFVDGSTDDVRMAWNRFALPGLRQHLTEVMAW